MAQSGLMFAKLFLEGKEVPFIGASINATINQASIAYVDVVPHQSINNIKPRTNVVISIRDFNDHDRGYPFVEAWSGEVFGFNFGKTPTSRTFTLSCIDYSGHWDNVLSYFVNAQQSLGKGAEFVSEVGRDLDDTRKAQIRQITTSHSKVSYFIQTITEKLKEEGTDLLDGIVEIYNAIGGINDFYDLSELRLRITDRIVLHSSKKILELLEQTQALEWFEGVIGQRSGYQTLRTVVQDLLSLIFHDYITVPFPSRVTRKNLKGKYLKTTSKEEKTIGSFVFKPNIYMIPPPMCNIFFPEEYSSFQYSRNFLQEPTRLIYRPELPLAFNAGEVSLPHVYEPPSLDNYMLGKRPWSNFQGDDDTLVPTNVDPGRYGETDGSKSGETNQGLKREAQFLTNEERMKGILMAIERMMPANSKYRQALNDTDRLKHSKRVSQYLFVKKRYENRQLQTTSHLKMSVVPGFPVLILDDSEADQNMLAYCTSVTHRIYSTEGGHTNVVLGYPRSVTEEEAASKFANEPTVPPWFEQSIFGSKSAPPPSEEATQEVNNAGNQLVSSTGLSNFYKALLGDKASKALTNYNPKEPTVRGAVRSLLKEYRTAKASTDPEALKIFIAKTTSRDYVRIRDSFDFIGASTTTKDLREDSFVEFSGRNISGKNENGSERGDFRQIKLRQDIINTYRNILRTQRGFRG